MYGYVYKTTNLINNKIYVGQHKSEKFDTKYFGSGIQITKAFNKYGLENFRCELIESCESENQLNEREIYWIAELDARNPEVGYNIATGGAFGDSGYHLGMLGKSQSDYQKQKVSEANKGPKSQEAKDHMREKKYGNTNASGGKGMKFIHKGDEQTRVHEEDIPQWLAQGWERGKSEKWRREQKERYQIKYANGDYITDGIDSKFVDYSEMDEWFEKGWKLGKGPKNYKNRKHTNKD